MTEESADRLHKILSKRYGRELTKDELNVAYESLIGFATSLLDLSQASNFQSITKPEWNISVPIRQRNNV